MLKKWKFLGGAALVAALTSVSAFADVIQTFDADPTLSNTQAPGTWYTDRYNPAGFESDVFDSGNRLHQTISSTDSSINRPGAYSSNFYNTQGRKYDVSTTYMSIDLYIPDLTNVDVGKRFAGFWGTAVDTSNNISGYPIIEYHRQGALFDGAFGFSTYDPLTGLWTDLGSVATNKWYTLEMELNGDDLTYTIGSLTSTVVDTGSVSFINTILQGYNPTAGDSYGNVATGASYDIYWDNFATEAPVVPVPAAAGLGFLGMSLVGILRRRKKAEA